MITSKNIIAQPEGPPQTDLVHPRQRLVNPGYPDEVLDLPGDEAPVKSGHAYIKSKDQGPESPHAVVHSRLKTLLESFTAGSYLHQLAIEALDALKKIDGKETSQTRR